ncbi:PaaI family thioesterase [Qipengyuania sp. DGS5-3]|uniref:PaaI family thioesterase n=1 Tax=Qipengyuania sp. DGS5-3 TaxID=3349632 RepID=UPI0036D21DCB
MTEAPETSLLTPYARSLGVAFDRWEGTTPILRAEYADRLSGRPGALHGGAISGLLETAGYATLRAALGKEAETARLKPINITVQFLRAGNLETSFSSGRIVKLGRRTANISVEAWQNNREKPIAAAIMNVMIVQPDAA